MKNSVFDDFNQVVGAMMEKKGAAYVLGFIESVLIATVDEKTVTKIVNELKKGL